MIMSNLLDKIGLVGYIIASTKKDLQSDWQRGLKYLYSIFNICTLEREKAITFNSFAFNSFTFETFQLLKNFHIKT